MANEQIFSGRAGQYSTARPSYAASMVDEMYDRLGLRRDSVMADIGSGTGKFSRSFLERGNKVFCIEPNDEMRRQAEVDMAAYPGFVSLAASAEKTGLPDHSVDAVTCAQSFHWFDVSRFRRECSRILKPDGKVFLTWNMRQVNSPVNIYWAEVYARFSPRFHGFNNGLVKDDIKIRRFFHDEYEYKEFSNPLIFRDREVFIQRMLSSSHAPMPDSKDYMDYQEAAGDMFDRFCVNGTLMVENASVLYWGK